MSLLQLTHRAVTTEWDRKRQEHVEQITDEFVYINEGAIEFVRPANDSPGKYASQVHTRSGWDFYVVESVDEILRRLGQPIHWRQA